MGYGRILPAAAILLTASCHGCVERVDVVPGTVTAVTGRPFLMSVRLTDKDGHLMGDDKTGEVRWKASDASHLTLSTTSGAETMATLSGSPTGPITLTASVDRKSGDATILLAKPGLSVGMDWATAPHIDNERPTLVLADGHNGSEWRSDSLIAFVGGGPLDKFGPSIDFGEVTVFSPGHALQRMNVTWSNDCDHLRMSEGVVPYLGELAVPTSCRERGMTLAASTPIPIHIWTLVAPIDPTSRVGIHLSEAKHTLANGWTGLALVPDFPASHVLPQMPIVLDVTEALGYTCPTSGPYSVSAQLDAAGVSYGPGKLTVVYANAIVEPSNGLLVPSSKGGYACPRDPILGNVVVISWEEPSQSIMGHELGHAIGPPLGHTTNLVDFDESNLMWPYEYAVPAARSMLTLGQAFRLSLDGDAFLPQPVVPPPDPKCTAQNELAEIPCPRLAKDVVRK